MPRNLRCWLLLRQLLLPSLLLGQSLTVSPRGGFFDAAPNVTFSCNLENARIFYTTNGHTPTANDRLYTEPLALDSTFFSPSDIYKITIAPDDLQYEPANGVLKTVVLRAAAFNDNNQRISKIVTQIYIVRDLGFPNTGLPVISICADSAALFDFETGIFVSGQNSVLGNEQRTGNYFMEGRDWERAINAELLMPDGSGFNQTCGLRTHGGMSRYQQQKGMKIYARDEYGKKKFSCKIFPNLENEKFKHLIFKPFGCSWTEAGVENWLAETLARQLNLDVPAVRPAVLFLNGEYWGIYYIQEKPDERFLEDHYGNEPEEYNVMSNWVDLLDNGTDENFQAMMAWLATADFTNDDDYAEIQRLIDLDNFTDYQAFQIFIINRDWPANNMRCWQHFNGPWRWIFYDGDAGLAYRSFDAFANATYTGDDEWPANNISTLLFRKLLENESYKKKFVNRYNSLCNSILSYHQTAPYLADICQQIRPEIQHQMERFNFPKDDYSWSNDIKRVKYFLEERPHEALTELLEYIPEVQDNIQSMSCFPNPSTGDFSVSVETTEAGVQVVNIFDFSGRLVFSRLTYCECGANEIPLSTSLRAGGYVLQIGGKSTKIAIK